MYTLEITFYLTDCIIIKRYQVESYIEDTRVLYWTYLAKYISMMKELVGEEKIVEIDWGYAD